MFSRHFPLIGAIFLFGSSLTGCQSINNANFPFELPFKPSPSPEITPQLADVTTLRILERELYRLVNQYRRSRQLSPLVLNPSITQQARIHSERMAAKTIPFGSNNFQERVETLSITLNVQKAAENIAINPGYGNPVQTAFEGWLSNRKNRQEIEGDFNKTGIGIAQNLAGEYYITQILIKEDSNLLTQSPPLQQTPELWQPNDPFLNNKSTKNNNAYLTQLEQEIHRQVNQYRLSKNLPPLQIDPRISQVARIHSQDMANGKATFSHDGFEQRVKAIGVNIPYKAAAENLAYLKGYPDLATTAVQGWINSPGHRKNMEGNFDLTGIGIAKNGTGEYYFTQLFVLKR